MALEKFTVSRDESRYHAWPDLVLTNAGKLICLFTECNHHIDRNNSRIMMTESLDRGRNWSEKKPFTELTQKDGYYNCARISKKRDGSLVILCDRVARDETKESEILLWQGDSEGNVFSSPVILPFQGIVPDRFLELKSGRYLISAHFTNQNTQKLEQYLLYSDDQGKTWSSRVTVAADPKLNLCEGSILECDGFLVCYLRENSHKGHDIYKVISHDNGESWSELYRTPMDCGHRPVSGFLHDGSVMVTYRYMPSGAQNLFAAFLNPDELCAKGRQMQRVRIFPIDFDRSPKPDIGYSGWVQFEDHEIYVVSYLKDDAPKAFIRGYSFYPSDVMASPDHKMFESRKPYDMTDIESAD